MARRFPGRPKRRPRSLSPRLIVACEGEKTEYEYLTRLDQSLGTHRRIALKLVRGRGGGPVDVVKSAVLQRDSDAKSQRFSKRDGDAVYALIDVEPHDSSRIAPLNEALQLAQRRDVTILLSNPSFEFWLLCHVAEAREVCRSFPTPAAVDDELKRRNNRLGKDVFFQNPERMAPLLPKASHAVEVARHVHQTFHRNAADLSRADPSTAVYTLVARMLGTE